jgi:hypothetical protein
LSTHQNHTLGFTLLGLNLLSTPHIARTVQLSSQRCSTDYCLPKPSWHDEADLPLLLWTGN